MRAHYLQHVPFEGLGSIGPWLEQAGYGITGTHLHERPEFPDVDGIDLLVVMGGPMSVNDEDRLPWLVPEKRFIAETIRSGRPVLGICLGAQLIASVQGARVGRNPEKEIGWFPVEGVSSDDKDTFHFPPSVRVFHWHGETFNLPPGATRLAGSAACRNQAFQLGRSVIGLQFHLEVTPESVRQMVAAGRDDLVPAPHVQTEAEILSAPPEDYAAINRLMGEVLAFLHAG